MISRSYSVLACALLILTCAGCGKEQGGASSELKTRAAVTDASQEEGGSAATPASASSAFSIDDAANRDVTFTRFGGRAFAVKDFGSEVEGSAVDVIEKLESQALAGDATASYAIFLKLYSCANFNRRRAKDVASSADEMLVAQCDGLSAEDEVAATRWLSLAAEQGNIGAQLLYSMDSESALGGTAALLSNPEATIEYKQRANHYLETLASQGSLDALVQLGNAYQVGIMREEDVVSSRAYFEAARLANPSGVSKQQLKGLERSMTAEQLSMALRKGEQIYAACCR